MLSYLMVPGPCSLVAEQCCTVHLLYCGRCLPRDVQWWSNQAISLQYNGSLFMMIPSEWFLVSMDLRTFPLLLTLICPVKFTKYKSCPFCLTRLWYVFWLMSLSFLTCWCVFRLAVAFSQLLLWFPPVGHHS